MELEERFAAFWQTVIRRIATSSNAREYQYFAYGIALGIFLEAIEKDQRVSDEEKRAFLRHTRAFLESVTQ